MDRLLGWLPHTSREWIELIIMTVLLWLLMMAVFELELGSSVVLAGTRSDRWCLVERSGFGVRCR